MKEVQTQVLRSTKRGEKFKGLKENWERRWTDTVMYVKNMRRVISSNMVEESSRAPLAYKKI